MDDGSEPRDATLPADAAWRAGGDAWAWAASIRARAAWAEHRRAWQAKTEADDALGLVAAAGGRIVNSQGMVDTAAMARAAESMRRASATFEAAAKAFRRSSGLNEEAAADERMAASLYEKGNAATEAALALDRAEKSRRNAAEEARVAAAAGAGAAELVQEADAMDESAAGWSGGQGGQHKWDGDKAALVRAHEAMRRDAVEERVRSAAMLANAVEAERLAARVERLAAEAARHMAESAAYGRDDPNAQEALDAWRDAMAAANRAADEHAAGRMA